MIKTDSELAEKLEQLARYYRATRIQYQSLTKNFTDKKAAKLALSTGKIVGALTIVLSEIEEYTGAAEVRRLTADIKDIGRAKGNG